MTSNALEIKFKFLSKAYKNLRDLALMCFPTSSTSIFPFHAHQPVVTTILLLLNQSPSYHRAFAFAILLPYFHMAGLPFGHSGLKSNITFSRKHEHLFYISCPYISAIMLILCSTCNQLNKFMYLSIHLPFTHFSSCWLLSTLLLSPCLLESTLHENRGILCLVHAYIPRYNRIINIF